MLEVSAAAGEKRVGRFHSAGTRRENLDNRGMGNAALFAIDPDAEAIARSGVGDKDGATESVTEPKSARHASLDDGLDFVSGAGQMNRGWDALGTTQARRH